MEQHRAMLKPRGEKPIRKCNVLVWKLETTGSIVLYSTETLRLESALVSSTTIDEKKVTL